MSQSNLRELLALESEMNAAVQGITGLRDEGLSLRIRASKNVQNLLKEGGERHIEITPPRE